MLEVVLRQTERDSDAHLARLIRELGVSWIATVPNRRHSANEYLPVKGYRKAIVTVRLFSRIANAERS